jgi:hypothetical protein
MLEKNALVTYIWSTNIYVSPGQSKILDNVAAANSDKTFSAFYMMDQLREREERERQGKD